MTSPILVTGGTGNLGNHVVPLLQAAGHDIHVLCRTPGRTRRASSTSPSIC
ncbi:NAD-dependent epimerase/dehydratase family protein [Streptomyces sp. M10(2022)]